MNHYLQSLQRDWEAMGALGVPLAAVCLGIWFIFLRNRQRMQTSLRYLSSEAEWVFLRLPASWQNALRPLDPLPDVDRGSVKTDAADAFSALVRRELIILAALTTAAPLLGLLGTVSGMMDTFSAVSSSTVATDIRVANGISKALLTTQLGLVIAIPGVFGLARLRRLARHVEIQLGTCAPSLTPTP